jgi:PilZ domain
MAVVKAEGLTPFQFFADGECKPLPATLSDASSPEGESAAAPGVKQLDAHNQQATGRAREPDARHHPRFKIQGKITVRSRTSGILQGEAVDLSKSGIAAILRMEVPLNELVELEFTLPFGEVRIYAVVRQRLSLWLSVCGNNRGA